MQSKGSSTTEATPVGQRLELRPSPKGGLGIFAIEDLKVGTLILIENPLIVLPHTQDLNDPQVYQDLEEAFQSLSPKRKEKFHELTKSVQPELKSELMKIFKNNCIGFQDGDGVPCEGIYLNASRINHSCIPNATYIFDEENTIHLRNIHPIKRGEEVTIKYSVFYDMMTAVQRAAHLKQHYGFTCNCPACQGETRSASDRRRAELAKTMENMQTAQMESAASSVVGQSPDAEGNAPPMNPAEMLPMMAAMKEHALELARIREEEGLTGVTLVEDYRAAIETTRSVALIGANGPNPQPMDLAKAYVELRDNTEKWKKYATICFGAKATKEIDQSKDLSGSLEVMKGILKEAAHGIDKVWAQANNLDLETF